MNYKELKTTLEEEFKDLKLRVYTDFENPLLIRDDGIASGWFYPMREIKMDLNTKGKELTKVIGYIREGQLLTPKADEVARKVIKKLV